MNTIRRIARVGAIITLIGLSACVWYDPRMRGSHGYGPGQDRGYSSQRGSRDRDRGGQQGDHRGQWGDGRYNGR